MMCMFNNVLYLFGYQYYIMYILYTCTIIVATYIYII